MIITEGGRSWLLSRDIDETELTVFPTLANLQKLLISRKILGAGQFPV